MPAISPSIPTVSLWHVLRLRRIPHPRLLGNAPAEPWFCPSCGVDLLRGWPETPSTEVSVEVASGLFPDGLRIQCDCGGVLFVTRQTVLDRLRLTHAHA